MDGDPGESGDYYDNMVKDNTMPFKPLTQSDYDGKPKRERGESRKWQKLYNYRWQQYSKRRLISHPLCVECLANGRTTVATCTDHRDPHKGNVKKFWDKSNHDSLCKTCHDIKTQNEGAWGKNG